MTKANFTIWIKQAKSVVEVELHYRLNSAELINPTYHTHTHYHSEVIQDTLNTTLQESKFPYIAPRGSLNRFEKTPPELKIHFQICNEHFHSLGLLTVPPNVTQSKRAPLTCTLCHDTLWLNHHRKRKQTVGTFDGRRLVSPLSCDVCNISTKLM